MTIRYHSFLAWTFAILMLGLASGLYILKPGIGYVVLAAALAPVILAAPNKFLAHFTQTDLGKTTIAIALYNLFFIIMLLFDRHHIDGREYATRIFSMLCFLFTYLCTSELIIAQRRNLTLHYTSFMAFVTLCALAISLISQIAQMHGLLPALDTYNIAEREDPLFLRPGGFQNANMTAAMALVFLFGIDRLVMYSKNNIVLLLAISMAIASIALTQSRAAIIFLIPYLAFRISKLLAANRMLAFGVVIMLFFGFFYLANNIEFEDLYETTIIRFHGDDSSNERAYVLLKGLEGFSNAPFFGNGYRFMEKSYRVSTHDELVEHAANFGIAGFIILLIVMRLIFWPISLAFAWASVLPSFLFSHNFFDNLSFQAALGFALATDRFSTHGQNLISRRKIKRSRPST